MIRSQLLVIAGAIICFFLALNLHHIIKAPEKAVPWSQCFWRGYRAINWLAFPFYFYFFTILNAVTIPAVLLGACYWFRLPFEAVMRRLFHNWSPQHSIVHSSLSLIFFGGTVLFFADIYRFIEVFYLGSLAISLVLDILTNYFIKRKTSIKTVSRGVFFANAALYPVMFCFIYLY